MAAMGHNQRGARHIIALLFALLGLTHFLPIEARAQDYRTLFQDFRAENLTHDDKRFLQTALAFEGHYVGLLDGKWGNLSARAMTDYSRSEFGTGVENWHTAMLALEFFELLSRDGWDFVFLPDAGISILWPEKAFYTDAPSDNFLNYRHTNSSLAISMGVHDGTRAGRFHEYAARQHSSSEEPYFLRERHRVVSSVVLADGSPFYTRSDFVNGSWTTVMLSAERRDHSVLSAMASSINIGRAPRLAFSEQVASAIEKTVAFAEEAAESEPTAPAASSSQPEPKKQLGGSGTGFVVSSDGHVLTNAHVVSGCAKLLIDGKKAETVATAEDFDLALISVPGLKVDGVATFSARPAKLNSDVTAIGFPYASILGGLNVTRGSVSALTGLFGDQITMQITAPVQPGNSGGPLLASDGEVVGVVVAKLNAITMLENTGDIPQNVNFAIRGELATLFLSQNGVDPALSLEDVPVAPEVLAEQARSFTKFIECN